jgi:hypothetical protein
MSAKNRILNPFNSFYNSFPFREIQKCPPTRMCKRQKYKWNPSLSHRELKIISILSSSRITRHIKTFFDAVMLSCQVWIKTRFLICANKLDLLVKEVTQKKCQKKREISDFTRELCFCMYFLCFSLMRHMCVVKPKWLCVYKLIHTKIICSSRFNLWKSIREMMCGWRRNWMIELVGKSWWSYFLIRGKRLIRRNKKNWKIFFPLLRARILKYLVWKFIVRYYHTRNERERIFFSGQIRRMNQLFDFVSGYI